MPTMLLPGDKIALLAPARKVSDDEIRKGIEILQSWGFEVVPGKNLYGSSDQFSGTDEERISDFNDAINNPEIKAIICARGGYGCLRIIDKIDFSPLKKNFKLICGYSDITVLHNHLLSRFDLHSVHCTMPINMHCNSNDALQLFKSVLEGKNPAYEIKSHSLNRTGNAEGILFGGNLSIMYALNGSSSIPDPSGKILFLEDLDEYLYHIDRMMVNLDRSGILSKINGLIIGGMTDMKDNKVPYGKTAEEIISENVSRYNYPVCFGFPAGHIDDNCPLMIGKKVSLNVGKDKTDLKFF